MYTLPDAGDVACPKCGSASGTRCTYTYAIPKSRYRKAWRSRREGEPMEMYHAERYAKFRELRDNKEIHDAQLRAWLFLHADMFKENDDGRV